MGNVHFLPCLSLRKHSMANEISYNISLSCAKGFESEAFKPGALAADKATIGAEGNTQIIGTSDEVVSFGDLAAARWCALRNLDTTNYVDIGPESGGAIVPLIRLKPGEACLFPLKPSAVLRGQANTSSVKLKKLILET